MMAEAFGRVQLEAAYYEMMIEDEEDLEKDNDEKMDVDPDSDCENIETRSSPSNSGASPCLSERYLINQEIDYAPS
ncbi:hypothetical protein Y032_0190g1241 [Ancylostoma ceylanicum]|uniref:Uncharacterized protein n=1 Tax=Ancylostoma ceylanicum TaxID=53326 RepID=A0A016SQZ4_9BILA|nr:hypothetical protein Y032_0190g1241 [Ancylostoma ceylanicum]